MEKGCRERIKKSRVFEFEIGDFGVLLDDKIYQTIRSYIRISQGSVFGEPEPGSTGPLPDPLEASA